MKRQKREIPKYFNMIYNIGGGPKKMRLGPYVQVGKLSYLALPEREHDEIK